VMILPSEHGGRQLATATGGAASSSRTRGITSRP
jgi:hypothetical protein